MQPTEAQQMIASIRDAVSDAFVGSERVIERVVLGLVSGLNVLIEDIPGVGKTTLARAVARASGLEFGRIQCTPDLLPGDITGMTVWSQEAQQFVFRPGAVMHQFVLADELNRAATRTQAALLEAMQERRVTVDGKWYELPEPFFLVATENPLRFAGTFQLPEAQLDRFGLALSIGYPSESDEQRILEIADSAAAREYDAVPQVCTAQDVVRLREASARVAVHDRIKAYLVAVARATRGHQLIRLGVSPRGTYHLLAASRAAALAACRDFVIPEDVRGLCTEVLAHRIVLAADARIEQRGNAEVLEDAVSRVPLPTGTEASD